jgi:hypothetical protein
MRSQGYFLSRASHEWKPPITVNIHSHSDRARSDQAHAEGQIPEFFFEVLESRVGPSPSYKKFNREEIGCQVEQYVGERRSAQSEIDSRS